MPHADVMIVDPTASSHSGLDEAQLYRTDKRDTHILNGITSYYDTSSDNLMTRFEKHGPAPEGWLQRLATIACPT
jgi:hypothetical protein